MNITEEFLIEIGKRISEIRNKNEQTLDDIEFLTGIDSSDISKYELGKINLTMKTLIKLSLALRIKPKDLVDFKFDFEKYSNEKS
ncbi:helix-turn-helix domain-containing protein [Chryseobacterium sp. B21-037]|uniref:helix-turn-helix domain-containing protein n=1 Tax=Chryseobacterium sp. B21-037 TaxID=2926038 RepID=UPI002359DFD7|nr:helix-turn-helix transcriptional regulator [Chryseobacterium sp. B21-037]MDC8105015.1 helix-turn-helix domain-containing protein [Chryseobacterium sp. B21-037]